MNAGIWRSWHAIAAVAVVAALLAWHTFAGHPFGSRDSGNVVFLLTTGWLAVVCYLALAAYAMRRAAHRLRLSPEFAWKAKLPNLERAQSELRELHNRIARREVVGAPAALREAHRILRRQDVHRVLSVAIEPEPQSIGLLRVRTTPREPLGRLAVWLQAHIWLGATAAVLVICHGGLRTSSTMGLLLNVLSFAVIGTGVLGAIAWTFGPTWLTRAERELSIEQAWALRDHYARKVAEATASLRETTATSAASALRTDLGTLHGQQELAARELRRLEIRRELMRAWRLVHVPCSILLLALVAIHVLGVWIY